MEGGERALKSLWLEVDGAGSVIILSNFRNLMES